MKNTDFETIKSLQVTCHPNHHQDFAPRLVRISELCNRTGLSRSMVYEKTNPSSVYHDPTFPRRIHLGARAVGFLESDIEAWIKSRIDKTEQIKAA